MRTPMKFAVEMYGPPISLDTHVRVTVSSTRSSLFRISSNVSTIGRSTMPCTRNAHSSARSRGTLSAVSIR